MVTFRTDISYDKDNNGRLIGAQVIIYNDNNDKIDTILITDSIELERLKSQLENLDSKYVDVTELNEALTNEDNSKNINAKTLNGLASDKYSKTGHTHDYAPVNHANNTNKYGVASNTNYGHTKIINNLTSSEYKDGEALSSYQGKLLLDKINELTSNAVKNSLKILVLRKDGAGAYGTKLEINKNNNTLNGIYFQLISDDPDYDYSNCYLSVDINGVNYTFSGNASSENRRIYSDGHTGVLGVNLASDSYILIALARGSNEEEFYPAQAIKRIIVK